MFLFITALIFMFISKCFSPAWLPATKTAAQAPLTWCLLSPPASQAAEDWRRTQWQPKLSTAGAKLHEKIQISYFLTNVIIYFIFNLLILIYFIFN